MAGRKRTHWIWFVLPQVEGLGHSAMSQRYAIKSKAEAMAYLAHPLLGTRLMECSRAVLSVADRSAHEIFGSLDDVKYRSSMTLFDTVDAGNLFRYFDGECDPATLAVLAQRGAAGGSPVSVRS
jgi:uncharacterized protein (DUF1810 family)